MILSNTAIFEALDEGRLVISPEPGPRPALGGTPSPFDTCAVDLTLGQTLLIPRDNLTMNVDLRSGDVRSTLAAMSEQREIDPDEGYRLVPGKFILGQTAELISLPLPGEFTSPSGKTNCLAARVEGKSSRARFGLLIHFTAPTIHAGWSGPIALEIINLGQAPIVLYRNMPICQLILEEVVGVPFESPSQFHGQTSPAGTS